MNRQFAIVRGQARRLVSYPLAGAALTALTALPAHAAFAVPTEVTEAAVSVGLIGAAVFGIAVAVKLWKWLRGAL